MKVRLTAPAYIDGALHRNGAVIDVADDFPLAPHMSVVEDEKPEEPAAPDVQEPAAPLASNCLNAQLRT